jgi:hypothetical protein
MPRRNREQYLHCRKEEEVYDANEAMNRFMARATHLAIITY